MSEKKSYKESLNLPQTNFAMEAKLVQNEPVRLAKWKQMKLYEQLMESRKTAKRWVLHDGPPFANGDIHIGHLINKTLKDIILRFRSMQGYQTPYVPGWDCHGLPIEHKIQEEIKKEGKNFREVPTVDMRKRCFAYADKYAKIQSEQFQRLGILGDWSRPYLTMAKQYEADTLEVFAKFVEAGLVYKQLKPVPWSVANQTALADAELEYEDVTDQSVYVEFPVATASPAIANQKSKIENLHLLVWTTTPWTLPANLAVAASPQGEYALVQYVRDGKKRVGVIARNLVDLVLKNKVTECSIVGTCTGEELAGTVYQHPFIERTGKVLNADYVTTTATEGEEPGTGLVHIAPGHGEEDYEVGVKAGLEVYSPVLANGRFDDTAPEFIRGKSTREANPLIVNTLANTHLLLAQVSIKHSYPHDWRSKTPIIFRATEQWFIAMDRPYKNGPSVRDRAKAACESGITFIPEWGKHRIGGMLASRPDWCVSRQRAWGLPIPVFYNEQGEALLTPESVRAVANAFAARGSDAWFTDSPAQLLGSYDPGPKFPKDKLRKETDIFDVWFESGSSWNAVLRARDYLAYPADMYLEGSDQHRGWFQLSLLPSLGTMGQAPYKQVLTHGFVVKPDGKKVSKSDKEYVTAVQEIDRHGADLLRLWCSSVDYQNDIPTSPKVLQEFGDKYRKIRNTIRYLLSNTYDFDPKDRQEIPLNSLDGWAMAQLDELVAQTTEAYENYQLHRVFKLLHDFCAVQISAIYGNAMKDRLYCEHPAAPLRRRCQTVMRKMAIALVKLLSPICVYTADEAWEQITHKPVGEENLSSVHLAMLPKPLMGEISDAQKEEWNLLMQLRSDALGQIDKLTRQIGKYKALDAEIIYKVDDDALRQKLQAYGADLEDMVGCGSHSFAEKGAGHPAVTVLVEDRRDKYQACARSWKRRADVGQDAEYPDLCLRDAQAMKKLAK